MVEAVAAAPAQRAEDGPGLQLLEHDHYDRELLAELFDGS